MLGDFEALCVHNDMSTSHKTPWEVGVTISIDSVLQMWKLSLGVAMQRTQGQEKASPSH